MDDWENDDVDRKLTLRVVFRLEVLVEHYGYSRKNRLSRIIVVRCCSFNVWLAEF